MERILIEIVKSIDELSRAVERGDVELQDFRDDLVDIVINIKELNTK